MERAFVIENDDQKVGLDLREPVVHELNLHRWGLLGPGEIISLTSQYPIFFEVVVVNTEKVCDFVDKRDPQLLFDLFGRAARFLDRSLKDKNPVGVQWGVKVSASVSGTPSYRPNSVSSSGTSILFQEIVRRVVLHDDRDIRQLVFELLWQS